MFVIGISSFSLLYWSFYNYQNINNSLEKIATPNDRTNNVNQVFQKIIEADNAFNTFILTDDSISLKSYYDEMEGVHQQLHILKEEFDYDSNQKNRLDSLEKIVKEKSDYLNVILKLKKEQSSAFFTSEALQRIGRQLKDSAFIERALLQKQRLLASRDTIENEKIIRKLDDYKGISGFFRKIFGKPNIEIDTIRTLEEQIDYSLEMSVDTSIVRDYFIDTTLTAVKKILLDVLEEEVDLQSKLNQAELQLIQQDQSLVKNIKLIVEEILYEEKERNNLQAANMLEKTNQATQQIFMIGGVGILLSAVFLFLLFQDVSKANQLRKTLQYQKDKAENLARAKEDFLAKMSHEIRTPLHNIMGFSELLAQQNLSGQQEGYLKSILHSNRYLNELIDNILEQSKIDAGSFSIERTAVYIPKLAREMQMIFRYKFMEKSLDFKLSIQKEFENHIIFADELKLKQVLINLIGNAVKFTSAGYIELSFALNKIVEGKAELNITVEDSGNGISEQDKEIIFEQFKQGEQAKLNSLTGSGLGLAISKYIIEAFNGEIGLETIQNVGTRFYLFFPVSIQEDDHIDIGEDIQESNSLPLSNLYFPIRVLLVEDDVWNAKLMDSILSKRVDHLEIFDSAEKAIEHLKSSGKGVDLILTDISLPGMDGIEFFKCVMEMKLNTPVVALTAHILENKKQEIFSSGFTDLVNKPFKANDILQLLHKYFPQENKKVASVPDFDVEFMWEFAGQDQEEYQILLNDFCGSLQDKASSFQEAYKAKDLKSMGDLAHQLKSSLEQLKYEKLSEDLHSIEIYATLKMESRLMEEAKLIMPKLNRITKDLLSFRHQYYKP